jgi:phosphoglycerate dehydrogenase-like enzyme
MKLVVSAALGKAQIQKRLAESVGDRAVWVEEPDAAVGPLMQADALICPDHFIPKIVPALRTGAPNLRWIQLTTAGYDHIKRHGAPSRVVVCNAGEAYAPAVATHAVALLLALQRRIPIVLAAQARHEWSRGFTSQVAVPASSTVAVIGFGPIGREVGRLLRSFGAHVVAVTRRGRPDPLADEVQTVANLPGVLARADAIVIAASYDESTHQLIGAREFALCKPNAVLVNIARGGIVDPRALESALRDGRIAGAGIDVTEPEPLPVDDPLWDAPNLIITPHVAGACGPLAGERLAGLIDANLRRFMKGEALQHVVDLSGGTS